MCGLIWGGLFTNWKFRLILFFILGCMTISSYLSFSTLYSRYLWRTDTIISSTLNKPPIFIRLPLLDSGFVVGLVQAKKFSEGFVGSHQSTTLLISSCQFALKGWFLAMGITPFNPIISRIWFFLWCHISLLYSIKITFGGGGRHQMRWIAAHDPLYTLQLYWAWHVQNYML